MSSWSRRMAGIGQKNTQGKANVEFNRIFSVCRVVDISEITRNHSVHHFPTATPFVIVMTLIFYWHSIIEVFIELRSVTYPSFLICNYCPWIRLDWIACLPWWHFIQLKLLEVGSNNAIMNFWDLDLLSSRCTSHDKFYLIITHFWENVAERNISKQSVSWGDEVRKPYDVYVIC